MHDLIVAAVFISMIAPLASLPCSNATKNLPDFPQFPLRNVAPFATFA